MRCPACNEPAIALELNGIEIDRCPACAGIWLDEEEIAWLARHADSGSRPLAEALRKGDAGGASERRCPRCDRGMRRETLSLIELDRCPVGHGIWFDSDEIETFLAGSHQGDSAAAADAIADILGRKQPPIPVTD